jgi:Xaa-Pro dipeptidase
MQQAEEGLVAGLLDAQRKAQGLFAEIQAQNLIRPGAKETEINEGIYALAGTMYGISRYWHKTHRARRAEHFGAVRRESSRPDGWNG